MNNYYRITIKGKNVHHIFNRILKEKINIFDVSYEKNLITLNIKYEDLLKIKKLNTTYDINIVSIKGIKKYQNIFKFYRLFIIFFFINLLFIFIYSKMIFGISIDCQNDKLKHIVEQTLKKENLMIFSFQKSFKTLTKIKDKIKQENKDLIEWVEISKNGVFYNISIIERKQEQKEENTIKHDIVASKNGIIKDMYITSGEIRKNKGDYVAKGEVIVSSNITKNEDVKNIVDAKGKVFAETWYRVTLNSNLKTKIKEKTGTTKTLKIKILNKEIPLIKLKAKNTLEENIKYLYKDNIFSLYIEKKYFYKEKSKNYSKEELLKILENQAREKINSNLKENEKILLQKTLKNTISNGKMNVEVFFKVYEDIAEKKESIPFIKNTKEN